MKNIVVISLCAFVVIFHSKVALATNKVSQVINSDNINWGYLNPLRGALSPQAANLWGDRTKNTATGMLVRFKKGFQSPPHIHNITYRGVVIDGLLHNETPNAEKMWMPKGSFWTQPAGKNHVTAANGDTNLIYLEIDSGPYLVKPSKVAFDNGEHSLNLHKDNVIWLGKTELNNIKVDDVESTYVWGSTSALNGSMIKLPKNFRGTITTEANEFRAVLISGKVSYSSLEQESTSLIGGSYIESTGSFTHEIENIGAESVVFYIRTNNTYQVN